VADVDGDTLPDIVTANRLGDDVSVLRGDGVGGFDAPRRFATGDEPSAVQVADVDLDGHVDLVTANEGSDDFRVLLGTGGGRFAPAAAFETGREPVALAVALLDGDAVPDVVTVNRLTGEVSVRAPEPTFGSAFTVGLVVLGVMTRRRTRLIPSCRRSP